ncbi:hypothetical protein BH24ACT2_BH24ACT2_07910 [soil metagenome]
MSVYVSEDLYDEVRRHGIAVSTVAQSALEAAVAEQANRAWAASYARNWFSPTEDTFSERWSWATGSGCSMASTCTGRQRDCSLVTTDARLAAADPPCEVVLIPRSSIWIAIWASLSSIKTIAADTALQSCRT